MYIHIGTLIYIPICMYKNNMKRHRKSATTFFQWISKLSFVRRVFVEFEHKRLAL